MVDKSSPNIAMVTIVAGLAGAGLALLFAPRSGKDTRASIKKRSTELKDQAGDGLHKVRDNVTATVDKTRDSLTEALNKRGHKANEQYDEFSDTKERTAAKQSPVLRAWEEEV